MNAFGPKDPMDEARDAWVDRMLDGENPQRPGTDPDNRRWSALAEAQRNMREAKAYVERLDGLLKKHFGV